MSELDLTPLEDDGGSYDELAVRAGVEARLPDVGEYAADALHTAALYWPAVPSDVEATLAGVDGPRTDGDPVIPDPSEDPGEDCERLLGPRGAGGALVTGGLELDDVIADGPLTFEQIRDAYVAVRRTPFALAHSGDGSISLNGPGYPIG